MFAGFFLQTFERLFCFAFQRKRRAITLGNKKTLDLYFNVWFRNATNSRKIFEMVAEKITPAFIVRRFFRMLVKLIFVQLFKDSVL